MLLKKKNLFSILSLFLFVYAAAGPLPDILVATPGVRPEKSMQLSTI
jgi:hypothetical protein